MIRVMLNFVRWGVLSGMVIAVVLVLIMALGPLQILEKILQLNGHQAAGFRWTFGDEIVFSAEKLGLADSNKTLEVENLSMRIPRQALGGEGLSALSLSASKIHFVDETKPVESLKYLLGKFSSSDAIGREGPSDSKNGKCLRSLKVSSLSFAVSHSARPWMIQNLQASGLCFSQGQIKFENIELESQDIEISDSSIGLKIDQTRFYDVSHPQKISFRRHKNFIELSDPELLDDF